MKRIADGSEWNEMMEQRLDEVIAVEIRVRSDAEAWWSDSSADQGEMRCNQMRWTLENLAVTMLSCHIEILILSFHINQYGRKFSPRLDRTICVESKVTVLCPCANCITRKLHGALKTFRNYSQPPSKKSGKSKHCPIFSVANATKIVAWLHHVECFPAKWNFKSSSWLLRNCLTDKGWRCHVRGPKPYSS